jgi:hypothetical protein
LAGLRRKNGNRVTARFYDAATILFADFEGFTKLAESMEPKELIRDMNPSVSRSFIDAHMADDPARAQAEYLAQFRTDVERFIPPEIVEACVGDFRERSPMTGFVYSGFVDPSGGSDAAMTLAIGHKTTTPENQIVIDVIREVRPPFDPGAVVEDFAALLKPGLRAAWRHIRRRAMSS